MLDLLGVLPPKDKNTIFFFFFFVGSGAVRAFTENSESSRDGRGNQTATRKKKRLYTYLTNYHVIKIVMQTFTHISRI
jgi:hypothetical protein